MDEQGIVSAWNALLLMFGFAFSEPVAPTFCRFLSGWVLTTGRHTVTGIMPFADPAGTRSYDAYAYLLRKARWHLSSLWRCWTRTAVAWFAPHGPVVVDLDDTLFHKSGRQVDGADWWRDAVRSTGTRTVHALGLNLVVLTLRVQAPWGGEPLGLPINMRLHRKGGPGLLVLAAEMIREVAGWLPGRDLSLHADGFYASLAGKALPRTTVTSRMRRDAALYDLAPQRAARQRGRPRKKGPRLATPERMAAHVQNWVRVQVNERGHLTERLVYARQVLWYQVCGSAPVWLVISRDPAGHQKDDFFFTTNLQSQPAAVIEGISGRWCIEDTFRNTKQYLGAEEIQVWKGKGPERAAGAGLLLYALVWCCYLRAGPRSKALFQPAWYPQKQTPSFQDALYALRRALWSQRIFRKYEDAPVPAKIVRFLTHALAACA